MDNHEVLLAASAPEPDGRSRLTVTFPDGSIYTDLVRLASAVERASFRDRMVDRWAGLDAAAIDAQLEALTASPSQDRAREVQVGSARLVVQGADKNGRLIVAAFDTHGKEIARDKVDRNSSRSRKTFANSLRTAGLDEDDTAMDSALRGLEPPDEQTGHAGKSRTELRADLDAARNEALAQMPAEIVAEAEAMLADPRLIDRIDQDIAAIGVVGERTLRMAVYVQGTSRLLDGPVSAIVQGTSSSGKSYVVKTTSKLFPPEAVLHATDLTTNALYYLSPGSLMHKWVVAGERSRVEDDQKAEMKRSLREMISEGELRKAIPQRMPDGTMVTQIIHQHGPIAFVESTTRTQVFDEDANRCLLESTDETAEQTARIIQATARSAAGEGPDTSGICARHHALQRLLRRVRVRIPYAVRLAGAVPSNRPEARRAFTQMLGMIRAVALLHQRQRKSGPIADGDTIEATVEDYVIARRLLTKPLGRSLGGSLTDAVTRFAERLVANFGNEEFSSNEALARDSTLSVKSKVNDYLRSLSDTGFVECVEESRGSKPARWKVVGNLPEAGAEWLPTVAALEAAP